MNFSDGWYAFWGYLSNNQGYAWVGFFCALVTWNTLVDIGAAIARWLIDRYCGTIRS